MTFAAICIGTFLVLALLGVLALWANVITRNTGLFGDQQGDDGQNPWEDRT